MSRLSSAHIEYENDTLDVEIDGTEARIQLWKYQAVEQEFDVIERQALQGKFKKLIGHTSKGKGFIGITRVV